MHKTLFYYSQIHSPGAKALYQEILRSIREHKTKASVSYALSETEIYQALYAVQKDYPELFYVRLFGNGCYSTNVGRPGSGVEFAYEYSREEEKKRIRAIEGYISYLLSHMPDSAKKTEFGKALWLHDLISRNVKYDMRAKDAGPDTYPDAYRFVGGLLQQRAVCAGISELYQILCERSGLWCTYVIGRTKGEGQEWKDIDQEKSANHAWNLIRVENTFSYVDVTWNLNREENNRGISHRYFGMGDKQSSLTHRPDASIQCYPSARIQMPRCPDESRVNYFVRTGSYIHQLSELEKPIENLLNKRRRRLSFQLSPQLRSLSRFTVMDWVSKRLFQHPQVNSNSCLSEEELGIYEFEVEYKRKGAAV